MNCVIHLDGGVRGPATIKIMFFSQQIYRLEGNLLAREQLDDSAYFGAQSEDRRAAKSDIRNRSELQRRDGTDDSSER